MMAAVFSPLWNRASPLTWAPSRDCSERPRDCSSRLWRPRQESPTDAYRPLPSLPRYSPSHLLGWSLSMPSSIGPTVALWTGRSLRSQPRSDLAGGDHVVLVVFQHPTPRSRPGLRWLTVHGFGKPQLG